MATISTGQACGFSFRVAWGQHDGVGMPRWSSGAAVKGNRDARKGCATSKRCHGARDGAHRGTSCRASSASTRSTKQSASSQLRRSMRPRRHHWRVPENSSPRSPNRFPPLRVRAVPVASGRRDTGRGDARKHTHVGEAVIAARIPRAVIGGHPLTCSASS